MPKTPAIIGLADMSDDYKSAIHRPHSALTEDGESRIPASSCLPVLSELTGLSGTASSGKDCWRS